MPRLPTSVALVGVPNAGKSSLFNLLQSSLQALVANYPFATIEPNIATATVIDNRLTELAKRASSRNIIYDTVEIRDVAGLVKGASRGAGLGNKFLGHVREVDAIVHVVRCFQDPSIIHVDGDDASPEKDIDTIETELLFADLDSVTKRLDAHKRHRGTTATAAITHERSALEICHATLLQGKPLNTLTYTTPDLVLPVGLLTSKPALYTLVTDNPQGDAITERVTRALQSKGHHVCLVSCALERDIENTTDETAAQELREAFGIIESSSTRLVRAIATLLRRRCFFTVGPQEARAWSIAHDETAQQAAGRIHNDIAKGFVAAEVTSWETWRNEGNKFRLEGASYVVKDGDVIVFRHSSKSSSK